MPDSGEVIDVTVMPDGRILGVGQSHGLWVRESLISPWVAIPNSGKVISVTMMPDGRILGIGESKGLWTRSSLNAPWVSVPASGDVIDVTVMSDGTMVGVGKNHGLWLWNSLTSPWIEIPDSGKVISVTVLPDESIVGVGESKGLWTRAVPQTGKVIAIAGGSGISITPTTNAIEPTILYYNKQWQLACNGVGGRWEDGVKCCQELSIDGYSDWHLPTIEELWSLVENSEDFFTLILPCRS